MSALDRNYSKKFEGRRNVARWCFNGASFMLILFWRCRWSGFYRRRRINSFFLVVQPGRGTWWTWWKEKSCGNGRNWWSASHGKRSVTIRLCSSIYQANGWKSLGGLPARDDYAGLGFDWFLCSSYLTAPFESCNQKYWLGFPDLNHTSLIGNRGIGVMVKDKRIYLHKEIHLKILFEKLEKAELRGDQNNELILRIKWNLKTNK